MAAFPLHKWKKKGIQPLCPPVRPYRGDDMGRHVGAGCGRRASISRRISANSRRGIAARHGFAGHGFVACVVALGAEVSGFCGSVRVLGSQLGCTSGAGVLPFWFVRLGLHF